MSGSVRHHKQWKIATELHAPLWVSAKTSNAIPRNDAVYSLKCITPAVGRVARGNKPLLFKRRGLGRETVILNEVKDLKVCSAVDCLAAR